MEASSAAPPGRRPAAGPGGWETLLRDGSSEAALLRSASHRLFSADELAGWWDDLHPQRFDGRPGAWEAGHHQGVELLRRTAWWVAPPCTCEYVYEDTRAPTVHDAALADVVAAVTARVAAACGVEANPPNSCNLNYYPPGGGVGFHADDEPIFGGATDEKLIISLSLASAADAAIGDGTRRFELRKSGGAPDATALHSIELAHGDLVTMEGLFQTAWEHSVWPGDRMDIITEKDGGGGDKHARGGRINLTWRWIRHHLAGCPCCTTPPPRL